MAKRTQRIAEAMAKLRTEEQRIADAMAKLRAEADSTKMIKQANPTPILFPVSSVGAVPRVVGIVPVLFPLPFFSPVLKVMEVIVPPS